MDEETIVTSEEPESTDYLEGWDNYGADYSEQEETTSDPEADQQEGENGEEADEAGENGAEPGGTGTDTKPEGEAAESTEDTTTGDEDFSLTIRYMGKDETINSRAEAVVLAQKGRNYDTVYQRMKDAEAASAAAQAEHDFVQSLADAEAKNRGLASMTTQDYIDAVNVRLKMKDGMSEAQAKRELELEKREASVSQREKAAETQKQSAETEKDRVAKDKEAFLQVFPDVDMKDIPMEVWQTMSQSKGMSLSVAYAKWLAGDAQTKLAEAESKAKAAEQKASAAKRTPGSMKNNNPKTPAKKDDTMFAGWEF